MNIRQVLFWAKDMLTGGKLKADVAQMRHVYEHGITAEQMQNKLEYICAHACATVPAYAGCDPKDILSFPVVNKAVLKENYEAHKSSRYLSMEGCRTMSTSGSTGTPFTVIQNSRKTRRNTAAVFFFGEMAGYTFGERTAALRVWSTGTRNSLKALLMNSYQLDISDLSPKGVQALYSYIKKKKIRHLQGYSSTFIAFADVLMKQGIQGNGVIKSIISASETLPLDTEKKLENLFGISVGMRYSDMECGIIAERLGQTPYYIDSSSYFIEILDMDKDEPVPDGQVGRIVVTDLYNEAFPMIRYDTGDTGSVIREEINSGAIKLYFNEVYGRRTDMIYDTTGKMLSPHVVTNNMWTVPCIKQFKFTQTGEKTYTILLNVTEDFNAENVVRDNLVSVLGADCQLQIEYIDEIPVLASGKRRYIENIWKK